MTKAFLNRQSMRRHSCLFSSNNLSFASQCGGYRERVRYRNRGQITERNISYLLRKREPRFCIGYLVTQNPHSRFR